ncbi:MAG TPA: hypothetical protein VLG40_05000 [Candidatus Saccharimonas sp.]|nr:hypothetical protein [Candidatus Saccharimonas sp.]
MKKIIASCLLIAVFGFIALHSMPAHAIDVFPSCGTNSSTSSSTVCTATSDKLFGPGSFWNRILETFTFIIGSLSVLMIIIGGVRYTVSGGEEKAIKAAKNTILYSIVGLVVAMMAYAIVHFVITQI